jgi:hypothetical protein
MNSIAIAASEIFLVKKNMTTGSAKTAGPGRRYRVAETLYPRTRRRRDLTGRRWYVFYDLAYDGGGSKWVGYYKTKRGAKLAAWWNVNMSSWGGTAVLKENK